MKRKITLLVGTIFLAIALLTGVFAFLAFTGSFSIDSYHTGSSGEKGSTSSYTFRSTTTYQQPGNKDMTTSSYTINLGWFKITITTPTITSASIIPSAVINGSNVSLSISALNANSLWASIVKPDSNTENITLTNNANTSFTNTSLTGKYNVTFYANDSSGNLVNTSKSFTAALPVNVTIKVNVSVAANVSSTVTVRVLVAGTNEVLSTTEINGSKSLILPNVPVDISFDTTFDNDTSITILFNFNLSESAGGSISFGNIRIDPYFVVYGVTTTFSFTGAQVVIGYQNNSVSNKNNLQLEKCDNYSISTGVCISSFKDVTNDAVTSHDKDNNRFIYNTTSFSGFGIREVTPSPPGGGGGGAVFITTTVPIPAPELEPSPITPAIPAQLFDISLALDDSLIQDSDELSAVVTFESFGAEPTPIELTFIILDETENEVYREGDSITVEVEEVLRKSFKGLNLPEGKYSLVLHTLYNVNVFDEFRQEFEIAKKEESFIEKIFSWIKDNKWYFIVGILIIGLTLWLVRKGKRERR